MMKKVGIDARLIDQTGVGTYIRNLIRYLPPDPDIEYIIYIYSPILSLRGASGDVAIPSESNLRRGFFGDKPTQNDERFHFKLSPYKWHSLDEQTKFLKQINNDELDLMHFTYFSFPYFYNRPYVITIHDLTPYFFKTGKASTKNILTYNIKHFFYKLLIEKAVTNSKNIFTPTETIKKQIIKTFDIKAEKIVTTYEGINAEIIDSEENMKLKIKYGSDFFLYVGNFYPHKNVEMLIEAFKTIKNSVSAQDSGETKQKLVLVGRKDYFFEKINELIERNHLQDRILFYENATAGDLKYFYKNAKTLIFPSFSEGFGLPIIEAAYFGCPIIASNIDVFKEIIPDNKYFFNPNNVVELVKIINENKTYDKVTVNFNNFSFSEMAKKTFGIYKKNL